MSLNQNYKIIALMTLTIATIGWFAFMPMPTSKRNQRIVHLPSFGGLATRGQIIQLKIKSLTETESTDKPARLRVDVHLPFDYDDQLEFRWIPAEGVKISEGSAEGRLGNFKAGVIQSVEVLVEGFTTKENRQVSFQISGTKNGRKIYSDAIIASKPDETFEDVVKNVERLKQDENQ